MINLTENEKDFLNGWQQALNLDFAELNADTAWDESAVTFITLEKIFPTKTKAQIKGTLGSLLVKNVILIDADESDIDTNSTLYYSNYKDNEYCEYPL